MTAQQPFSGIRIPGRLCRLAAWLAVAMLPALAPAAVYHVAVSGDNGNDGSAGSPWQTIQHAVDSAGAGDEIRVAAGIYPENVSVPHSTRNNLVLRGGYESATWTWSPGINVTVIAAANAAADVIELRSVAVTVTGFTLRGGRYGINGRGGNAEGTYLITHCKIIDNASHGIRIQADGGSKSALAARNCLIAGNGGDGIYINVDNAAANSFIYNCTLVHNVGSGYRDQHDWHKSTTIANSIIANNSGYGVVHFQDTRDRDNRIQNTSIYGNALGNLRSGHTDEYASRWRLYGSVINGQPMFVDAAGGDYRLAAGSPCIAFGLDLSGSGVTDDIDGKARSGAYDLGCYQSPHSQATRHAHTYVDALMLDDSGDGTSPATAKKTIGAALALTQPFGTCTVAVGLYPEDLVLSFPVTLEGAGMTGSVISNTAPTSANIWIADTNITVRGFRTVGASVGIIAGQPLTATAVVNNRIEQCEIHGAIVGISIPRGPINLTQLLTVERTIVRNNSSHGIFAANRHGIRAGNCLIVNNGGMGIRMTADNCPYDSVIHHTTIANNASNGYRSENGSHRRTTFRNCIVSGNGGYGIQRMGGAAGGHLIEHVWNTLVYNNALGNLRGDQAVDRLRIEGGVIAIDPLFIGGGDYQLQSGSFAIARGLDLSADADLPVTVDLLGNLRTVWDMGCYESGHASPARATTVYVDASRPDDNGNGLTPTTAKKFINSGMAMTADGGTVHVAAGLYNEVLLPPANVTVNGAGPDVVKVTNNWHTAYFANTNAVLAGMTLSAGWHYAMRFHRTHNTVSNTAIESGTTAGVLVVAHNNRISNTTIHNNGIGVHVNENVRMTLDRCYVTNNTSHGVWANNKGAINAVNTLFADNGGDGTLFQSDNSSYISTFLYCTFANNGGNGYRDNNNSQNFTYMTNNIISGNSGYGYQRNASNSRNNLIAYSLVYDNALGDFVGGNIIQGDGMITDQGPQFVAGYRLNHASPCVNSALDIGVTIDLDGTVRPQSGAERPRQFGYDMGAFEYIPPDHGTVLQTR